MSRTLPTPSKRECGKSLGKSVLIVGRSSKCASAHFSNFRLLDDYFSLLDNYFKGQEITFSSENGYAEPLGWNLPKPMHEYATYRIEHIY